LVILKFNENESMSMMINAMRMNQDYLDERSSVDEKPNIDITRFIKLLQDFDEKLWDECTNHSKLLIIARVFTIKWNYELSKASYDNIIKWSKNILSEENMLNDNFYVAKCIMKPLA